ncbi:hypothetical protein ABZ953_30125 [Streptomyces sp. NPDC046465]
MPVASALPRPSISADTVGDRTASRASGGWVRTSLTRSLTHRLQA